MYQDPNFQPQFPTFSQETTVAIHTALSGKVQSLWEAEQVIVQAILSDTLLEPIVKAAEIQRAMARFMATASGYNTAATAQGAYGGLGVLGMHPYGVNYPGPYGREFMPGHNGNPLTGTPTVKQPWKHGFNIKPSVTTREVHVALTYNFGSTGLSGIVADHIDVAINDMDNCASIKLRGVLDNDEDLNAIGIIAIPDGAPYLSDEEFNVGLFLGLMGALGLDSNLYSFTKRAMKLGKVNPQVSDVLYIDLADGDDAMEATNFSDVIKGNFNSLGYYDSFFPAAESEKEVEHSWEKVTHKFTTDTKDITLVYELNTKGLRDGVTDHINVFINNVPGFPGISLHGVFDNNEDRNGVAIVAIAEPNTYFTDEKFKAGVFDGLMKALDLDSDQFGYSVRKMAYPGINTHETDALYIDLATSDDPMEADKFSDVIKGNFATYVESTKLFPESQ